MEEFIEVLTVAEAATLVGIAPSVLVRWAEQGRIPFVLDHRGKRLFKREDIERLYVTGNKTIDDPDE